MYPMPRDGEDEIVLEKGTMVNPETGLQTEYEEVWIEKDVDDQKQGVKLRDRGTSCARTYCALLGHCIEYIYPSQSIL
jgi:hypothetical protein